MPRDVALDVISQPSGRNHAIEYTLPQLLTGEAWQPQGCALELTLKDVRLANLEGKDA